MGRIWGTSQNLRCAPLYNFDCDQNSYNKILDEKLKEFKNITTAYLYVNGLRMLERNSCCYIPFTSILPIILTLQKKENSPNEFFKKYNLKHSHKYESK
jgi:hypothetical protein